MDLRTYLTAIRKGWWVVAVLTVLGFVGGFAYAKHQTPVYAAHVSFYVSTPDASQDNIFSNGQFAQDRATSYAELLSSDALATRVVATGHIDLPAFVVASEISAAADLNTVIVKATVKDVSASRALAIATAVGTEFPKMIDSLDNAGTTPSVSLSVVSGPSGSSAPVSPRKTVDAGIGLIIGLIIGLAIAVLREALNTSVRDVETLAEIADAPVLANVPLDRDARKSPLVIGEDAFSARAEALRQLRTNLKFIDVEKPAKVITVTSSIISEGKSATTANLALVMAETGRRVLVIEADLRRPHVSEYFNLERAIGLSNVLAGQVDLSEAIQPWDPGHLDVLASGTLPPNPSELLGTPAMAVMLARLRESYDLILLDTPPLLPVTDAAVLAVVSDGVLVVVRHGKTSRSQLGTAIKLLASVDARLLGVVLNMRPARRLANTKYGNYYQSTREAQRENARDSELMATAAPSAVAADAAPSGEPVLVDDRPDATGDLLDEHTTADRGETVYLGEGAEHELDEDEVPADDRRVDEVSEDELVADERRPEPSRDEPFGDEQPRPVDAGASRRPQIVSSSAQRRTRQRNQRVRGG